jgi:hypothetical protein
LVFVPLLLCAKDVVVGVPAGHPAAGSEALEETLGLEVDYIASLFFK